VRGDGLSRKLAGTVPVRGDEDLMGDRPHGRGLKWR